MCGIFGVIYKENKPFLGELISAGLSQIQNRGNYSSGIATIQKNLNSDEENKKLRFLSIGHISKKFNPLKIIKALGPVSELTRNGNSLNQLRGFMGVGHVRYPTNTYIDKKSGLSKTKLKKMVSEAIQPMVMPYSGIISVHNGDVHNFEELMKMFCDKGVEQASFSDLEVLTKVFADKFHKISKSKNFKNKVEDSVKEVFKKVKGTYSVIILITGVGLVAFRDPKGRKPLFYGITKNKSKKTESCAFASETVALEKTYYEGTLKEKFNNNSLYDEVKPGEMVFIDEKFNFYRKQIKQSKMLFCPFEAIYFQRASSFCNNKRVKKIREEVLNLMWERFVKTNSKTYNFLRKKGKEVIICPVPRTAETAAQHLAAKCASLGFKYEYAIEKAPSAGRIFMQSSQKQREDETVSKHYIFEEDVKGKSVILVDDSIVRGTTLKQDIHYLRKIGARDIHVFITFPPIRNPCMHAIDFHTKKELFAYNKSLAELKKELSLASTDSLIYANAEELRKAIGMQRLCDECYV